MEEKETETIETKEITEAKKKSDKKSDKKRIIIICAAVLVVGIAIGIACAWAFPLLKTSVKSEKKEEKLQEVEVEEYDASECVKLGKYKGREVSLAATEEDIQIEIDSLIEEYTTYEQERGIAQEGDMVYADYEGSIGGKKLDNICGSDYVELGSELWAPGFEDAILGMQCGQTKKFKVTVPEGFYGDDTVDGKEVDYKVTLKFICGESIIPEYNDEFVQSISNYETVKEHTAHLKKKLEKENEEDKLEFVWSDVLYDCKVKNYPKTLLASARKEVLQGYYDMAEISGMERDEFFQSFGCENEEDFKETQLEDLAKDTVKEILVAEAIAQKEHIQYTKEDYDEILKDEYENNSDSYKSKEDYEKQNKNYLEHTALLIVVKDWIGERTDFQK